jgi:hypothetical protein
MIDLSLEELVTDVTAEVRAGSEAITDIARFPVPVAQALDAGRAAADALTEVLAALGDLDPGAALIVTDALQRGLVGTA